MRTAALDQPTIRRAGIIAAAALAVLGGAGCARSGPAAMRPHPPAATARPATAAQLATDPPTPAASPPASQAPTATPSPARYAGPHFATPQQAMTYLAAAYNSHNTTELHYVTTPQAFRALTTMRAGAVNLHLRYCQLSPRGDYTCYFRHDYPARLHASGHGAATVIVAPAADPGWYMYVLDECG